MITWQSRVEGSNLEDINARAEKRVDAFFGDRKPSYDLHIEPEVETTVNGEKSVAVYSALIVVKLA